MDPCQPELKQKSISYKWIISVMKGSNLLHLISAKFEFYIIQGTTTEWYE